MTCARPPTPYTGYTSWQYRRDTARALSRADYWQCFRTRKRSLPSKNEYHVPHFKAIKGTTQGRLISTTLLNLIVYNVVSNWLAIMVEDQLLAQEGLGLAVGRGMGLFYKCDGVAGSWYQEWLQGALNVLICLFCRYRLVANIAKSKAMTCQLGTIRSRISEEAVGLRCTGRGVTYHNSPSRRIPFPY